MYEELVKRLNAYSAEHECHGGITAEAADAIEKLDTLLDGVSADNEALCETIEMLKKQVFDMSSLIGDYSEQTRWVSVEERLPSPEVEVLVFTRDRLIGVDKFFWTIFGQPTFSQREAKRITHWMPLPPAPETPEETI